MPIANISHKDSIGALTEKSTDAKIRYNKGIRRDYGKLLDRYPSHPVVIKEHADNRRVVRWKSNAVVDLMVDKYVNLNDLWRDFYEKKLPIEDMATVYRMMGYSLCGFIEVFGEHMDI
jgi:hypothetical protein